MRDMAKVLADDLLQVFVAETTRKRTEAIERLIEAAWKRGWEDAVKAHGYQQLRDEHRLEEAEMGLA